MPYVFLSGLTQNELTALAGIDIHGITVPGYTELGDVYPDTQLLHIAETLRLQLMTRYPVAEGYVGYTFGRLTQPEPVDAPEPEAVAATLQVTPPPPAQRTPKPKPPKYKAIAGEWPSRIKKTDILGIVNELLVSAAQRTVAVHIIHGYNKVRTPVNNTALNVWVYAAPVATRSRAMGTRLYGIDVSNTNALHPTDQGIPVQDELGQVWGEFVPPNNFYILYNALWNGNELKMWRKLVEEIAATITMSESMIQEYLDRRAAERELASRGLLDRLCASNYETMITQKKQIVDSYVRDLERLMRDVSTMAQNLNTVNAELTLLITRQREQMEGTTPDFESKFLLLPHVESVAAINNTIVVNTNTLYSYVDIDGLRRVYELGKYAAMINPKLALVKMFNREFTLNGYHGPHVFTDGRMCLGTLATSIAEHFAAHDMLSIAALLIQFIQYGVNIDDYMGKMITWWPQVDPVTKVRLDPEWAANLSVVKRPSMVPTEGIDY